MGIGRSWWHLSRSLKLITKTLLYKDGSNWAGRNLVKALKGLLTLGCIGIHQVEDIGDLVDHTDLANATQGVGHLGRQAYDVVLAHRHHLDADRVLVVVDVAAGVVGDELLGVLVPDWYHGLEEFHQLFGAGLARKVKIEAI